MDDINKNLSELHDFGELKCYIVDDDTEINRIEESLEVVKREESMVKTKANVA
jgi:hypothetical protein